MSKLQSRRPGFLVRWLTLLALLTGWGPGAWALEIGDYADLPKVGLSKRMPKKWKVMLEDEGESLSADGDIGNLTLSTEAWSDGGGLEGFLEHTVNSVKERAKTFEPLETHPFFTQAGVQGTYARWDVVFKGNKPTRVRQIFFCFPTKEGVFGYCIYSFLRSNESQLESVAEATCASIRSTKPKPK